MKSAPILPDGLALLLSLLPQARQKTANEWRSPAPCHGGTNPSTLVLAVGDNGQPVWDCKAGCPQERLLEVLSLTWADVLGPGEATSHRPYEMPLPVLIPERRSTLEAMYSYARPIKKGSWAEAYLRFRGIDVALPPALRWNPVAKYWNEGRILGRYPALVARLENPEQGLVTLHYTYLEKGGQGKARLPGGLPQKKKMPTCWTGTVHGAIRLWPLEGSRTLAVCEGIETACAVRELTGETMPVWAAADAGQLAAFTVPGGVQTLYIFADHDRAGQEAAVALRCRCQGSGIRVEILTPFTSGWDWLDHLRTTKGFRDEQ